MVARQVRDYKKRENALLFRISAKDQEMQELKVSPSVPHPNPYAYAIHRKFERTQL